MELRAEDIDKVSMTDMDVKAILDGIRSELIVIGLKYDYTSFIIDIKPSERSTDVGTDNLRSKKRAHKHESTLFIS